MGRIVIARAAAVGVVAVVLATGAPSGCGAAASGFDPTTGSATEGSGESFDPDIDPELETGGASEDGSDGGTDSGSGDDASTDGDDSSDTDGPPDPGQPGDPVLLFTDLAAGPNRGWQDGESHGAAVTVWGRNLGTRRGTSTIVIDGIELDQDADYVQWGAAGRRPGDTAVTFLVPAEAGPGLVDVTVTVDGITAAPLPFEVIDGRVRYVEAGGDGGDGSWAAPWSSIPQAVDAMVPGDVTYVGDGVAATSETGYSAAVNLPSHGEPGLPMALVALPGSTVTVGSPSLSRAFHNWVSDDGTYADHWTLAGFEIACSGTCINMGHGARVVGNRITAPDGDGQTGSIYAGEGDGAILGNELQDVGAPGSTKLYHVIYVSGPRTNTPPRLPPVGPYEIGWNYIHDNAANRAINMYSEQDYSAFVQDVSVHDNLIVDQRGDGILVGWYVTGALSVVDNVVVRAGLGPEWPDGVSSHAGLRIDAGHDDTDTSLLAAHNTLVDCGFAEAELALTGDLYIGSDRADMEITANIFVGASEPTVAGESLTVAEGPWNNLWFPEGPGWDATATVAEPAFVDPDGLDFRLAADSPAIDAAPTLDRPAVLVDFAGVPRPVGPQADIGAFEHVPD